MQELIRGNNDGQATIVVDRGGQTLTLHTDTLVEPRPTDRQRPAEADAGRVPRRRAGRHLRHRRPRSTPSSRWATSPEQSAVALATLPVKVWGVGQAIVGVKDRAADSPVSIVGGGRIAGETASAEDFPLKDKLIGLLGLIAGFNFFIGAVQLHPAAAARRRPHRRCALGGRPPRDRPPPRSARPGLRRRRQAAAGGLRRGQLPARHGCGPDRRRPRRPRERDLTRRSLEAAEPRCGELLCSHDRCQPGDAGGTSARARAAPQDPPDQGRQGRRRQRRPDLGPVDVHDAHLRRQHHAPADRRADRVRLRHRARRVPRARTTPTRCPRSRSTARSR